MDMMLDQAREGHALIAATREAARLHAAAWRALVPGPVTVDIAHEAAEEAAYDELAAAKAMLRNHIRRTYGVTLHELTRLATP